MSDKYIEKIHLLNFKGFRERKIEGLHNGINIFVGDNATGKSTILQAINLVLSANANRLESIGLDRLINVQSVEEFLAKESRTFDELPRLQVDVYLNDQGIPGLEGEHNIAEINACGMYLLCQPREDLRNEITELISLDNPAFPFEYYSVEIKGFGGAAYNSL